MGKGEMLEKMVDDVSVMEFRRGVNRVEELQVFLCYG